MEELQIILAILVVLSIIYTILNYIIFDPIRKQKEKKIKEKDRECKSKNRERIATFLKRKYNVAFYSSLTLITYDFIKTHVEETTAENKLVYNDFTNEDLLKYIDLYDEYWEARLADYKGFETIEEINLSIEYLLKEIKDYLYTQNIHFPYYILRGNYYRASDDTIKEELQLIKQQIEKEKRTWKYTKIKHFIYLIIIVLFSYLLIVSNKNIVVISILTIPIIALIMFWRRDTIKYTDKMNLRKRKLGNLKNIPKDTYSLANNVNSFRKNQ